MTTIKAIGKELVLKADQNISLYPQQNIWISEGTKLIFEGTVPDNFEAKLQATSVTADRDIILPDADGTIATQEWVNLQGFGGGGGGIAEVSSDTTPQLGGDLDLNSNNITGTGNINIAGTITSTAAGTPTLTSSTDINLQAGTGAADRVEVIQSPFKVASFTTAQRDAKTSENGDMIYNTTTAQVEFYQDSSWSSVKINESEVILGLNAKSGATFSNYGDRAITIGEEAGLTYQDDDTVAIGYRAGQDGLGERGIAIGSNSGPGVTLISESISLGSGAQGRGAGSIAIGRSAQANGGNNISIGRNAGLSQSGDDGAITIGSYTNTSSGSAANTITINATNDQLNAVNNLIPNSFVVKPVRNVSGTTTLMYDATTGEVTHTATPAQQTMIGSVQQISGPGAIDVTSYITEITTTGTDDAYTLADGVAGQIKIISMVVDGGDAIITPTTLATGTTITMADVNDNITLLYGTNGWVNTANQGSIIA